MRTNLSLLLSILLISPVTKAGQNGPSVIRVGHFPNITHAQAVVGRANNWFDKALAPDVLVEWKTFNAGPAIIEAMFAGELDMAYVGPSPAITGYVRSQGLALKVVAGSTSGGAALVVRGDSGINKAEDFHGKKIATPQFGNTQDIALRAWLDRHGLKPREKGGDVQIVPIANSVQLTLLLMKQIDGAWAPEPWASRLIHEGRGHLLVDERSEWPNGEFSAGLLIVNRKFLDQHPDLVKRWIAAHVDLTMWIGRNPVQSKQLLNAEIERETGVRLSDVVLDEAWSRVKVTVDPLQASVLAYAKRAADLGLLGSKPLDTAGLFDLTELNQVLIERRLKSVQ